ncbi:MAG: NAD+ synthase [Elusimicrobia bacterium]|nr:NAD+ synthase [Elusimicrobiota bacterium]
MKIALAQINPTVGDIAGNAKKILAWIARAKDQGADVVVFPEMALTGYPPEDLLHKPAFIAANRTALTQLSRTITGITAVVGFVDSKDGHLFNAAAVIKNKRISSVYHKMLLPNYGVFDEKRYFSPGKKLLVITVKGVKIGIMICEDMWDNDGPIFAYRRNNIHALLVLNASPYHQGKIREREKLVAAQAKRAGGHIVYVNAVGGQDELVFDGYSMVADSAGTIVARAPAFTESLLFTDLVSQSTIAPLLKPQQEVYEALVCGLRDYVHKNGFKDVVIGLSGGIDSALVATLAVDALGKECVHGVFLPTRYSANASREDAEQLAHRLGIDFMVIPIDNLFTAYTSLLEPIFSGMKPNITEENLQARIRGTILMALSNKFNWLLLTTGNKSEMSTGYATLYGDMAGGFAVLKDVPKMLVYALSAYRNTLAADIPRRTISKAPTAELRLNQKDSDSLPPYPVLDKILEEYIEKDRSPSDIIRKGIAAKIVKKTARLVDGSEYKRRQSPPGVKITPKAFGKDRRMPITNRYVSS